MVSLERRLEVISKKRFISQRVDVLERSQDKKKSLNFLFLNLFFTGTSDKMLLFLSFRIPHASGSESLTGFSAKAHSQDSTHPGKG
jgi:hypothetical protein